MRPEHAHSLFLAMRAHRSAFVYSGAFHDDHTARLIALGEAAMAEDGGSRSSARGRLAFVMVEAYQNILRHRSVLPPGLERRAGRSMFVFASGAHVQQVVAWNPVAMSSVPKLEEVLEGLRGLDPDALKRRFLSVLQREHDGRRKGAGLGLIEMARRSGGELGYELLPLDTENGIFVLIVRIGGDRSHQGTPLDTSGLHRTVVEHDLLLAHMGERPAGVQEALLRMVEEDVDERVEGSVLRGRTYLAACGCLDVRAAPSAPRFTALTREGRHFGLTVGCVLEPAAARELEGSLAALRSIDRVDLERRYRNALLKRAHAGDDADTLDLARLSVEPLEVASFPLEQGGATFTVVRALI